MLVFVWIPNLGVNIYHAFLIPQDRDPYNLITFLVNLASLQGILNSAVYLWGYKPFRKWFKNLYCSTYMSFLLFGNSPDIGNEPSYYVPLKTEEHDMSNMKSSPQQEKDNTTVWERIASGEKNVRFGLGDEYNDFVERSYSDGDDEYDTDDYEIISSAKPRKSIREKIGNWWKRKRSRQSSEFFDDEEDVETPLSRSRSNSVNSVDSSVGDEAALTYKKTPPRKSMTRRDRSGSPVLVRVPSAEDKKWKKAPVVFE